MEMVDWRITVQHKNAEIARLTAKREELHNVNEQQALEIARLRAALKRLVEDIENGCARDEGFDMARKALANEQ